MPRHLSILLAVWATFLGAGSCLNAYRPEHDREARLKDVSKALAGLDLTLPAMIENLKRGQASPWSWEERPPQVTRFLESTGRGSSAGLTADSLTADSLTCLRDLYDVATGLERLEMWALSMIDSSTKFPSGILQGNVVDLGQYDECVAIERPNYVGQHALVFLLLGQLLPGNGIEAEVTSNLTAPTYKVLQVFTVSTCLPSTCSSDMIAYGFNAALSKLNSGLLPPSYRLDAAVLPSDCHTKNRDGLYTEDWVVSAICCIIIVIAIISTTIDLLLKNKEPSRAETVLKSFSVYTNGKKLFGTKAKGNEMTSINGIKFFSMAWVVLGHKYLYKLQQPLVNPLRAADYLSEWTKMLIYNATVSVDTFFLMSGLLNAYGFFSLVDKKRKYTITDVIVGYIHRFIRLSPPYMIMMAITGSILYRFGDGPAWDRTLTGARDACQDNWWINILYVNNYVFRAGGTCLMQSWYLGADMQMFWLAPLVLYPLWRWPLFGKIWLLIVTIGSIASPFAVSYVYNITSPLPVGTMDGDESNLLMKVLYLPTHTRTISYVVGIITGYLLQKVRTNQLNIRLTFMTSTIGWLIAGVFLLYSVFGGYWFFQPNNPYNQVEDSFYIAFFRFLWVVGVAWVIFACVTGHGGIIDGILSLKIFWPLGRLSYATYLTHAAVLTIKTGMARTAVHLNDYDVVEEYIGDLFFTICTAIVLSLLLEAPTLVLEKLILGDNRRPPTKKIDPEEGTQPEGLRNSGGERLNY